MVTVVSLVGVLTSCGGAADDTASTRSASSSATGAQAAIDPCGLISASEAEQALGGPVGSPERPAQANIPPRLVTCRYVAPRGQGVAVLSVMVRQGDSDSEARIGFQSAKEQFPGAEAVPDLGDQAFWFANQLNVLRGRVYLNITGDFDSATARSLAERALKRLP
jgi:hypothetical protein